MQYYRARHRAAASCEERRRDSRREFRLVLVSWLVPLCVINFLPCRPCRLPFAPLVRIIGWEDGEIIDLPETHGDLTASSLGRSTCTIICQALSNLASSAGSSSRWLLRLELHGLWKEDRGAPRASSTSLLRALFGRAPSEAAERKRTESHN